MSAREFPGDAEYVVVSAVVSARCAPDGHYELLYRDSRLPPSVDPNHIQMLLDEGMIARLPKG